MKCGFLLLIPGPWTASYERNFPGSRVQSGFSRRVWSVQQSLVGWKHSMNTHGWATIVFRVLSAPEGLYLTNNLQTMWELLKTWGKAVKN